MALQLNSLKVLPQGIHSATLEELRELFGGFQRSDRRVRLYEMIAQYVAELRGAGISGSLVIDGSFIMGCVDEPSDVDLVLILSRHWDLSRELSPFQYNLVSKRAIRRRYKFDVFPVIEGSTEEAKWLEFFSQVNVKWYREYGFPNRATKGLVRIDL